MEYPPATYTSWLLEETRNNLGQPGQRRFSWLDKQFYLNVHKPSWCDKSNDMYPLFSNKWQLFEHGIVVWGHIVQANALLFESGPDNCPASVIFQPTIEQDFDIQDIALVAHQLYDLKGTQPEDRELRVFADNLTDELTTTFGLPVPKSISPKLSLVEASTFVSRKHLPNAILTSSFFPLIISPQNPHYNLPVPSRFWPAELIDYWND